MNKEQFKHYLRADVQPSEESLLQLKNMVSTFPWFQTGWVVYLMQLKQLKHPDFENTLKKVALMVPDRKKLYQLLHRKTEAAGISALQTAGSATENKTLKANTKPNALIDKFLSTNPGIIRSTPPDESHRPQLDSNDIIAQSAAENDDLITETLANIYLQQKNYDKALDAFQKLSLKYPEKSIYFASRIKEIEVIKNNI